MLLPAPGLAKLAASWSCRASAAHDGKSVTPDDVVASFQHHMGPDSKSAAKSLLDPIESIKADGPETVVFTMKGASADFPYLVSDYHIPIMPSKTVSDGCGNDRQKCVYIPRR